MLFIARFRFLFQRYASALLLSMTLRQFIKATKKRFLFCIKNRPGFHCGNRGGSFVLLVLFQALTQSLAGILDSSLGGCQNYRALGRMIVRFYRSTSVFIFVQILLQKYFLFDCDSVLQNLILSMQKSCRTGKTGAATLFAGTCTGATGRTSRRNTLIYQRRQRSPSGTFQCRHQSEGGGSSAPAPYMARWQCVHRPVRSP